MQESNGRGGGGGGGLPSGDDVEAALGCPLHPLDAEGGLFTATAVKRRYSHTSAFSTQSARQQLWARGEALGGHLAQSVGGVRRLFTATAVKRRCSHLAQSAGGVYKGSLKV